ncbi:MAG: histidine kinase [Synergistaceae bacterium]|nr:histidine kinase [Synergistaceae bacterium]MBR0186757.1 histidine kinase [Synergistaceae bacterium]
MSSWVDIFYFFIGGVALLLSMLGLWFTAIMPGIDRWSKHFFLSYFIVLMLCCIFNFTEVIFYYYPVSISVMYFVVLLGSMSLALPLVMLTVYLLHCCGENMRSSKLFYAVLCMLGVHFVQLAVTPFTGFFLYVMPNGRWDRGFGYPFTLLPLIVIMLLNLAGVIKSRKHISHKTFLSFLTSILPITIALFVQIFFEVFPLIDISYVISALSMYSLILSDQITHDMNYQREIANQRANIMVLQMRPHFIYNTMTSIYCLCNQNPKLARQVIMDFTTYLRKNFTAIASAEPIPFSSELEHTRAYLAVEQAQYEESLFVDYDTPHTCFRVPPLTLQPIVENAIKHGRDPYAGPFRVSIRTRKTDSGSEIVVADNGRGFTPNDDGELHIALKNIQQRLKIMCSGSLTITPNDGGGTVVTVMIPDSLNGRT